MDQGTGARPQYGPQRVALAGSGRRRFLQQGPCLPHPARVAFAHATTHFACSQGTRVTCSVTVAIAAGERCETHALRGEGAAGVVWSWSGWWPCRVTVRSTPRLGMSRHVPMPDGRAGRIVPAHSVIHSIITPRSVTICVTMVAC